MRAVATGTSMALLLLGATGCFGLGLIPDASVSSERAEELRARGTAAEATVVSVAPGGVIVNRSLYLLRLELDVPVAGVDGNVVPTRVVTDAYVHLLAFSAVQPKSKVPIRFDPRRPADLVIDFEAMGYRF